MLLPIYIYGHPVLRKVSEDITADYEGLGKLIDDMFQTMYESDGVGLAAPQIGRNIRLFVVDGSAFAEIDPACQGFKKAFINAHILERWGDDVSFNEGCLSIPGIHEDVVRKDRIKITYRDENWVEHTEEFEGLVLLAAYSTSDISGSGLQVLSVYGSEDRVLNMDSYEKYREHLPADFTEVVIPGGCHAYFGCYGAQKGDGTPGITNEEQIRRTAEAIGDLADLKGIAE